MGPNDDQLPPAVGRHLNDRPAGVPRRAGAMAASLAGAALLLAACGGGTPPLSVAHIGDTRPTSTTLPAGSSGAFPNLQQMYQETIAYSGCMRAHGDPGFPDPVLVDNSHEKGVTMPGRLDQGSAQYKSANKACQHLLPNGGQGPSQAQIQQGLARLLKAAECMRAHGVPNFPDPTESAGGEAIGFHLSGVDPNSPRFRAAQKACSSLSPLLGGPG